ncbi:CCAAT/enhancer-binding protein gamma [Scaptodrosophila lebanonensis]|uniref:CCAAT/enhancer-binding protein gamma n=1 Tax=Drosophila lebanonensis TaxID=7225 RepID=A0A6J2UDA1_DROLE|nr:CCAAT/enhancer-binding protein gamma [Scaptodrosophila lebanonensis]
MPARRRTAAASTSPRSDDPQYQLKRQKNNEAVQRTREKTRKSAEERKKRIEELKMENIKLKAKIQQQESNISMLRSLIIKGVKTGDQDRVIHEILQGSSDDDEDEQNDLTTS